VLEKRRLAVLGEPVAHSRSPAIHNAAFSALGMADEWSYEAIEVSSRDFDERVRGLVADGFVGANVTIPHKRAALELADQASERAEAIGAANTLSFVDGRVAADNTDAPGFLDSLPDSPSGKRVLVLGAGGSARAVIWALAREGASVEIWNRTAERARELAEEFGADAIELEDGDLPSAGFDVIANATSVGLTASDEGSTDLEALHLDPGGFSDRQVVVDLVYGPTDTELARAARVQGARVVAGHEILVQQAALSFRIWTGVDPPIDVMRQAARA
jgi:shikimate dehydrogenase